MIVVFESLESRRFLTAAQDITSLTALRADPNYAGIDGSGIGIAVLDTGTFAAHPDLRNNFVAYFDAVRNSASSPGSTDVNAARDPDGHGTHTAGTAASSNPDIGVATNARLIAVRALPSDNESEPSFDTVANGLQWVLNNVTRFNIRVVNLSLGVPSVNDNTGRITDQESALIRRLENLGVTVVAAAGNNWASFAPAVGAATPAAYSTLIAANTWADTGRNSQFPIISGSGGGARFFAQENDAAPDRFAATSQRATLPGSIAAPGSDILSTWNSTTKLYQYESGTSMSAPFISGAVALMQEAAFNFGGRYLTPAQVRTVMVDSADDIVDSTVSSNSRIPVTYDASGNPRRAGANQDLPETGRTFKRINVYAAVRAVRALVTTGSATPAPDPTPPPAGTDPDAVIATATTVPSLDGNANYSFTGRIGTDGSVTVGGADVDLYALTVLSPGAVSATLSLPSGAGAFSPTLRLFDSAGNQLSLVTGSSAEYPSLVSGRLTPGTYYLGVSATGNAAYSAIDRSGVTTAPTQGDYALSIGLSNPDPNGVPQGAFATDLLVPNSTDPRTGASAVFLRGTIGSDPNPFDETLPRIQIGATDVDMFRLVAPDDGTLTIDTLGTGSNTHAADGVDTYVRVFDLEGNELQITQQFVNGLDAVATLTVTRGTAYFVGIGTFGNRTYDPKTSFDRTSTTGQVGSYDAYFSFDNGDTDGDAFNATAATVGRNAVGAVGADGTVTLPGGAASNKDVDFYRMVVPATGLIDLQAVPTASGFQPVLALFRLSDDRSTIDRDADTTGRAARIIAPVTAGETLYVSVTGDGNDDFSWFAVASGSGGTTGGYTLTSAVRPASDLARLTNSSIQFGTPTEAFANTPIYANLGTTNAVETGPASVNLYRYTATFTGQLQIRAAVPTDQSTDPFLRLFDAAGNELAFNDDADANSRGALITYTVVAGTTYYIGVNPSSTDARAYDPVTGAGAAAGVEGDYVLTLSVPPKLSLSGATVTQTEGGAGAATFTLTLATPTTQDVSADFATFDVGGINGATAGVDYTAVSTRVTIPAGQTTATVSVPYAADATPGRVRLIGGSLAGLDNARKGTLTASAVLLPASPATPSTTGADLTPTALTLTPSGPIVVGDKVPATLRLSNVGTAVLNAKFSLRTVISADPYASSDDLPLFKDRSLSLRLTAAKPSTQKLSLAIPAGLEAGTWYVISVLTPAAVAAGKPGADTQTLNNVISSTPVSVEWRFGTFAGHRGKKITLASADGTPVTFSLSGPGEGVVSRDESNLLMSTVTGTTKSSSVALTLPKRATTSVLSINVSSPIKSLLASQVSVLGDLTLPNPPPATVRVLGR